MKKTRDGKRDQHNLDCTTRKLCFDPIFIDFHLYLNYLSFQGFFAATMRSWDYCSVPTDPSAPQLLCRKMGIDLRKNWAFRRRKRMKIQWILGFSVERSDKAKSHGGWTAALPNGSTSLRLGENQGSNVQPMWETLQWSLRGSKPQMDPNGKMIHGL